MPFCSFFTFFISVCFIISANFLENPQRENKSYFVEQFFHMEKSLIDWAELWIEMAEIACWDLGMQGRKLVSRKAKEKAAK